MRETGYYDFGEEIEKVLANIGAIEELLYIRDLKQRKLFLNNEITQASVSDTVRHIMQWNKEDAGIPVEERMPIKLYIATPGGEVDAGFGLIDAILASVTPVITINQNSCYSMGFLIFIAGHKRYAMPHSRFLCHDGSSFVYNSTSKLQDQMEFQRVIENDVKQYIISNTNITEELYDNNQRKEWYMVADTAKKLGVCDAIIGVDCKIDEII